MDRAELYDKMAARKDKPKDYEPYDGNNGRVNKCVALIRAGKLPSSGILVDVGGGIGDLGYAVKDLFYHRITVDISEKSLEAAAAKGNDVYHLDVDKRGLALNSPHKSIELAEALEVDHLEAYKDGVPCGMENEADLVVALDFIEHIIDPENFARECSRVLKSGGEVFINTPNIRFWKHIELLWRAGRFPHTSGDREVYHGGHLAFFTYRDLCDIFAGAGFVRFEQFMDDECFETPPALYTKDFVVQSQQDYMKLQMEFGCPNLLFKAVKA